MSDSSFRKLSTKAIHAGEPQPRLEGSVAMPIFQSAMFEYMGEKSYHDLKYIRLNNTPNHRVLHQKLAELENAEAGLVTASGMAAISTSMLALLNQGDHLLIQGTLYGGTHDFVTKDLPRWGIHYDFIDPTQPEDWEAKRRPETRAIYVETMGNPLLGVPHLPQVASFARSHGLVSMIDNTFASPVNFRPLEHGFDLSMHSGTKYLNGHSDIVAGAVLGSASLIEKITHALNHLGGSIDPHAAFLLHRGVKTLAVRMRQHNESAGQLARFLESHDAVAKVNYPGLESHPQHAWAKEWFDGFSGMLSFELGGGLPAAERLFERLRIPLKAPSLGGVESLVTRPAITSHAGMSAEDRHALGITDGLVRVSVGIEDPQELVEDFEQALG